MFERFPIAVKVDFVQHARLERAKSGAGYLRRMFCKLIIGMLFLQLMRGYEMYFYFIVIY